MPDPMSRGEWRSLILAVIAVAACLGAPGGYAPWISPDTPGYLAVAPLPEGWGDPRHPLFGWILRAVPGRDHAAFPALQTGLFLAASLALHHALRAYGASRRAAGSVTAALLGSHLLLLWHRAVHPEFPAATCCSCGTGRSIPNSPPPCSRSPPSPAWSASRRGARS